MARTPKNEMIRGFIEEVNTYIPQLKDGLESLDGQTDQNEIIEEVHRLVHTIKGASSLVGLPGLSAIASQMEDGLEKIIAGDHAISEATIQVMLGIIDLFDEYCKNFFEDGAGTRDMLSRAILAFRRLYKLPVEDDESVLQESLDTIPENEGFTAEVKIETLEAESLPAGLDVSPIAEETFHDQMIQEPVHQDPPGPGIKISAPVPELLESFYEEAEEHLEDLSTSLNTLESEISKTVAISPARREEIRRIRRSVHTLKGASAVIGFQDFSKYAHSLEDLLDWLFETAREISPDIISVLTESADLLERIVHNPQEAYSPKADALKEQYLGIMGDPAGDTGRIDSADPDDISEDLVDLDKLDQPKDIEYPSDFEEDAAQKEAFTDLAALPGKTLRVNMERIDEMVNLASELIIASSGFDQKMENFIEAVNELEHSRNRLKEIAREMEISYEVKALEGIGASLNLKGMEKGGLAGNARFDDFDTLELDRYSQLNLIIRTLNESAVDVGTINTQLANLYSDFEGHLTRQRVILSELQDKMMRVRMTPMAIITNRLHRTVREVSASLDKKVKLVIEGAEIELDKLIWEKITDPLMHLLRNAIDHGIESKDRRKKLGKPDISIIDLKATREGNQVVIKITDDGAGLDYKAIRATAKRMNLSGNVTRLSREELADLIFYPGFSTRTSISEVSGRGVGMDVVRANIRDLKGTTRITSEEGKGTEFTVRIPLTLATIRALIFKSANQNFAVALNEVKEIIRIDGDNIKQIHENTVRIGDEVLPLFQMDKMLDPNHGEKPKNPVMLVIETGGRRGVVVVDGLAGQREIVIKSLGTHLTHVHGISGATIMGDGSVIPILNAEEFFWSSPMGVMEPTDQENALLEKSLEIMVVDDSVSIRQVVSRLMKDQGWRVVTAKDGVEALEKLRNRVPDLIILDIEMPRMNGYEFLGTFRTQPGCVNTPVIILSSRTAKKHRDKAMSLGAQGYIVKPYNNDEFITMVLELTGG